MRRELYQERRLAGVCPKCGKPSAEGKVMCEYHLAKGRETRSKIVAKRRKDKKCLACGGEIEGDYVRCEKCRAKAAEGGRKTLQLYKRMRVCHQCGKVPVYLNDNYCVECATKIRNRSSWYRANRTDEQRAKESEQKKKHRQELLNNGLCRCGKNLRPGRKLCSECLMKASKYKRSLYENHPKPQDGITCCTCGKRPVKEGAKICEQCYSNLKKARSQKKVDVFRIENDIHFTKMKHNADIRASKAVKTN